MGRYGIRNVNLDDDEGDLDDHIYDENASTALTNHQLNTNVTTTSMNTTPNSAYTYSLNMDMGPSHYSRRDEHLDWDRINGTENYTSDCQKQRAIYDRRFDICNTSSMDDEEDRYIYQQYLIRQKSENDRRHRRRRYYWYTILSMFILLIAFLCQHDRIPPGPPPPIMTTRSDIYHDLHSWEEYIHEHAYQLTRSFIILCIHTPVYVIQHWIKSAYIDLEKEFMHLKYIQHKNLALLSEIRHKTIAALFMDFIALLSYNGSTSIYNVSLQQQHQQQCKWHVPHRKNSTRNIDDGSAYVIGQDLAIELIQNSITLWQQQKQQNGPLILFATGYEHTGKRTMACNMMMPSWRTGTNCYYHRNNQDQQQLLLHLHGRDWTLKDYEKDNSIEIINRARRLLYRKMIHTIQSHFYRTTNIANPYDQTHMILITNIEDMEPYMLIQFLSQIQKQQSNIADALDTYYIDDDNSNSHDTMQTIYSNDIYELCQNSIVYLTSNQYGISEIARYIRTVDANIVTSSLSSNVVTLLSDIRHTIQNELKNHRTDHIYKQHVEFDTIQILPFVPFTLVSLQQLLHYRINLYFNQTVHRLSSPSTSTNDTLPMSIMVTNAALNAILNERNVEYIEWRRTTKKEIITTQSSSSPSIDDANNNMIDSTSKNNDNNQEQTTYMKIVIDGANTIQDHNPIIMKLYTQIHQVIESILIIQKNTNNKNEDNSITDYHRNNVLVLDYDTTTPVSLYDRGTFLLCDGNSTVVQKIISSDTDSIIYSDKTNTQCKIINRFRI
jgi:hypothetical protein